MNTTALEYQTVHRALAAVLDSVPPGGWTRLSPCSGWSPRDVVAHPTDTQRELFAGRGIDLGEAPDVHADPAAAWRAHAERIASVLGDDAVPATRYEGYFGPTTLGQTLQQFYMEGICTPGVQAPPGADGTVRLLARLGRTA